MIPVNELLYGLMEKLNKVSTNTHQDMGIGNYISALRGAQIRLINSKIKPTGTQAIGFEGSRKRYQDLQSLIISSPGKELPINLGDPNRNSYRADLSSLNHMYILGGYILADKEMCKNRVVILQSEPVAHADVDNLLSNAHYRPSFEYQETFYSLGDGKIEVYTDGTFTPTKLIVEYLRYPKAIDAAGYVHLDGTASINQDCELEYYLKDELLELAVIELGFATENQSAVQGAVAKIQISE